MKPLAGIRILELAQFTFVPSAGAVLADWGAEVIKLEHAVTGDGQRGLRQVGTVKLNADNNPAVEHPNRGKRSVGLDVGTPEGREILLELAKTCDVFLTNFLPEARRHLRVEVDDLRAANPDIIYVRGTALGDSGPEREAGGYDMTAFWCRASPGKSLTPPDLPGVIPQPPAFGDTMGGMALAGGITAALLGRERTGEAAEVDVSLLGVGMWANGMAIGASLQSGDGWVAPPPGLSAAPSNPLCGIFETADDRLLSLLMLQGFRYWADFCQHIERPDLIDDERFATAELFSANAAEGTAIIREVLKTKTLAEWSQRFATVQGQWAPIQNTVEAANDPQARANGYIASVDAVGGGSVEIVNSPVQFDKALPDLTAAPDFAADTEAVLLELGLDWERIIELKAAGAIT